MRDIPGQGWVGETIGDFYIPGMQVELKNFYRFGYGGYEDPNNGSKSTSIKIARGGFLLMNGIGIGTDFFNESFATNENSVAYI